jgi:predicted transcriptional regulator
MSRLTQLRDAWRTKVEIANAARDTLLAEVIRQSERRSLRSMAAELDMTVQGLHNLLRRHRDRLPQP